MMQDTITRVGHDRKGMVRAFLLDTQTTDHGVIVIDALSDGDADRLLVGLERIGRSPADVRHIVLTHSHRSHIGGAARLKELSRAGGPGATVWAHEQEAEVIRGKALSPPTVWLPRRPYHPTVYKLQVGLTSGHYLQRWTSWRPAAVAAPPCEVDRELTHGVEIGPLLALHTPGHSPGHFAFYWKEKEALFTGDALATWPRLELGWRGLTLDNPRNRRAMAELAGVGEVSWIGVGHGDPIRDEAAAHLRRLLAGLQTRNGRAVLDRACERGLCGP